MRSFSVSKLILLSLIITHVCGAETTGDSTVSSHIPEQNNPQENSSGELTTGNPEDATSSYGINSDDSQGTLISEDPQNKPKTTEEQSQVEVPPLNIAEDEKYPNASTQSKVSPTDLKQVTLDLDIAEDTADYYYKKDEPWSSYTPVTGKIFNKVIFSVPYVSPVEIWKPKTLNHFATKVKVFRTNSIILFIDIALFNGGRKVFRRFLTESKWEDVTFPPDLKLLTHGKVVLDPSNYKLKSHFGTETIYTFNLKSDARCTKIKYQNETVWKYGKSYFSSNGKHTSPSFYPSSITYTINIFFGKFNLRHSEVHNFRVTFSDGSFVNSFVGANGWEQVYHPKNEQI